MNKFHLRTTTPFTRFNNDIALIPNQWEVLTRNQDKFLNQNYQHPTIPDFNRINPNTWFITEFLNQSFIYLITETACDYPYPFFTEKTWRAMVTGRPFMMINSKNSLKKLQDLGFLTFANWWDESYDQKESAADRIELVTQTLASFRELSINQMQELNKEMLPVIQHNQNHMIKFASDDLKNIANQI